MKKVVKTRLQRKHIFTLVFLLAFAVSLTASLILTSVLSDTGEGGELITEITEVLPGEARQNGIPLAYPAISKKLQLSLVEIKNSDGAFGLYHYSGDDYHTLYYVKDGETVPYYPDIIDEDPSFTYTDLFAIETGDGIGRYSLVDYLCSALQMPYFDQRVAFETDPEKLAIQLEEFGLDDESAKTIEFAYTDDLGNSMRRLIKVGDVGVVGTGYYFTVANVYGDELGNKVVEERPYIYSSLNNYFGYAESNISKFIKPLLVSEGLPEDNGQEPFLTTGYSQWLNTLYECTCREECAGESCTECGCGTYKTDNTSKVIVFADTVTSIIDPKDNSASAGGYVHTSGRLTEIDLNTYRELLEALKKKPDFKPTVESRNYERMLNLLAGRGIGEIGSSITLYSADRFIDLGDAGSVTYTYNVTAVEAMIGEMGDNTDTGVSAGDDFDAIRVTYTVSADGEPLSAYPFHAVIDFRYAALDEDTEAALRAAKIGDALDISFSVDYSEENAIVKNGRIEITEILGIYDKDFKPIDTVTAESRVRFRASVYVDDVRVGETTTELELWEAVDGITLKMKNRLLGKKLGPVDLRVDEYKACYEYMLSVTTYDIDRIEYFVKGELISSFAFKNASDRDPYYGESLYESLFDDGDKRNLYGLSSGVCETVVKILGGLSDESSSATAAGLSGDEVVAVGLTPDVMKKYGLYAHTVYFELPRGITAYEPEGGTEMNGEILDHYTSNSQLGFNLYISEVDPDTNMRYIGSDLYDIVTRVPAEDFVFLKYDFETFWARRNIILMQLTSIDNLEVEFLMTDIYGKYNFDITPVTGSTAISVHLTSEGECSDSKFKQYMADPSKPQSYGGASLTNLYLHMSGASEEEHKSAAPDSLGSASFRDAMRMIYFISYVDILPDEVREEAPSADDLVMKMKLDIVEKDGTAASEVKDYVYEFYRIDDRRVRVSIHQVDVEGNRLTESVDDFYISTFALKKIVNAFTGILNAELVNITDGYKD